VNRSIQYFLVIATLLASTVQLFAQLQQPPNWHIFTTSNSGLGDNRVYFLLHDDQSGVHWCATFNGGLSKVVGETITTYSMANSGIQSDKLRTLTFTPDGRLWIGSKDAGIISFDTITLALTSYNPSNSGMPDVESWGMTTDQFGNIWAAAGNSGLVRFDGASNWTVYNTGNSGMTNNWVNYVTEDNQGNIWVATGGGFARFDGTNWTTFNVGDYGRVVIQTTDGRIWMASTTRLTVFDGSSTIDFTTGNSGIPDNDVSALVEDQSGNLWLGTVNGGVAKYNGSTFQVFDISNSTLPDNYIETIDIDNFNRPWVGMNSGGLAGFITDTIPVPTIVLDFQVGVDTCYRNTGLISVTPSGGSSPYTFVWSSISDSAHFFTDPLTNTNVISSLSAGNYTVLVEDANGNQVHGSVTVPLILPPDAAFFTRSNPIEFTDPDVQCINQSTGATSYQWYFGDGQTSFDSDPVHTYDTAGIYLVMLVAHGQPGFGCIDTAFGYVNVDPLFTFYVPNAFTPDGDGTNDFWGPKGLNFEYESYELEIFDRWGGLMWRTDNPLKWWDGNHMNSNERVKQGVYVYQFRLKHVNTFEPKVLKGTVTLYRHN